MHKVKNVIALSKPTKCHRDLLSRMSACTPEVEITRVQVILLAHFTSCLLNLPNASLHADGIMLISVLLQLTKSCLHI